MAVSRYSRPFQVDRPQEVVDLEMLDNTLAYKQQNYDQGYLQISKTLGAFENTDLLLAEDKDYLNKKLGVLVEDLNSNTTADLSDPKVAYQMQRQAQALSKDKELMLRVGNTQSYRQWEKNLEKLKTDPKLRQYYSEINEWNDRNDQINPWLTGKSKRLNLKSPTLKVDVDKPLQAALKQLKAVESSVQAGMYVVDNKTVSEQDLVQMAHKIISSNPDAQAQLFRNSRYLNRDRTSDQIKGDAVNKMDGEIRDTNALLVKLERQKSNPGLSTEVKGQYQDYIDRIKGVKDPKTNVFAKGTLQSLEERRLATFNKIDFTPEELMTMGYNNYTDDYVKSVSMPYVQSISKSRPDQVAMFTQKEANDAVREENRQNFTREQSGLDRAQKERFNEDQVRTDMAKLSGQKVGKSGELLPEGFDATIPLPTMQNNEVDVLSQYNSKLGDYKVGIYGAVAEIVLEDLSMNNPELHAKIKPLLDRGSRLNKGSLPADLARELSNNRALATQFNEYSRWLTQASDPASEKLFFKNNTLQTKYGEAHNAVNNQIMERNALQRSIKKAYDAAYKIAVKEDKTLTEEDFRNNAATAKRNRNEAGETGRSWGVGVAIHISPQNMYLNAAVTTKYQKLVNEQLKLDSNYNKFNKLDVTSDDDPLYGKDKPGVKVLEEYIRSTSGIIGDDGVQYGVDGKYNTTLTNNSIKGFSDLEIVGFSDYTNRAYIKYKEGEEGKKVEKRGTVVLDPKTMNNLNRRSSQQEPQPFTQMLHDGGGKMVYSDGSDMWMNLNGSLPMGGNIQYRYWAFSEDSAKIEVLATIDGKQRKIMLGGTLYGQDIRDQGVTVLTDLYKKKLINLITANAQQKNKLTEEQINAQALEDFYKEISK